jgi:hypothetical protein
VEFGITKGYHLGSWMIIYVGDDKQMKFEYDKKQVIS